jgi:hypothetical protein
MVTLAAPRSRPGSCSGPADTGALQRAQRTGADGSDRSASGLPSVCRLTADETAWEASTFGKNRERLIGGNIAQEFRHAVLSEARQQRCLSDEQFVVDGTLIEAWASRKSYQPKDDPPAPGQGSGRDGQLTEAR